MQHLSVFCHFTRPIGRASYRYLEQDEYDEAEFIVLLNCKEMRPFFKTYEEMVATESPYLFNDGFRTEYETGFMKLFKQFVKEYNGVIDPRNPIFEISRGPGRRVKYYKGYYINGFEFHTREYARTRKTTKSGVFVPKSGFGDSVGPSHGFLVDIIELQYFGFGNQVVLFKCDWFGCICPLNGKITQTSVLGINDPFILAEQAKQFPYEDWHKPFEMKPLSEFNLSPNNRDVVSTCPHMKGSVSGEAAKDALDAGVGSGEGAKDVLDAGVGSREVAKDVLDASNLGSSSSGSVCGPPKRKAKDKIEEVLEEIQVEGDEMHYFMRKKEKMMGIRFQDDESNNRRPPESGPREDAGLAGAGEA